ncbi:MAG TPA: hypothetical protein VI259_28355 [Gemmatimonadaceae bacterium]|jgi:hypothetical protein
MTGYLILVKNRDRASGNGKTVEPYVEQNAPVLGAIRLLLLPLLPIEFAGSFHDLAEHVARHPEIAPHAHKVWGDLSDSVRAAIRREVKIVARAVKGADREREE